MQGVIEQQHGGVVQDCALASPATSNLFFHMMQDFLVHGLRRWPTIVAMMEATMRPVPCRQQCV
jgi:hypothetical protein